MGIKDAIINKMLSKMMGKIDMNTIAQNAKDGKYDINKMIGMMEKMIGKDASVNLMKELQSKIAKGEKLSMSSIMSLVKNINVSNIEQKAENNEISPDELSEQLAGIVGEENTKEIFEQAKEAVEEFKSNDEQ